MAGSGLRGAAVSAPAAPVSPLPPPLTGLKLPNLWCCHQLCGFCGGFAYVRNNSVCVVGYSNSKGCGFSFFLCLWGFLFFIYLFFKKIAARLVSRRM